jgi:hypothetical protein
MREQIDHDGQPIPRQRAPDRFVLTARAERCQPRPARIRSLFFIVRLNMTPPDHAHHGTTSNASNTLLSCERNALIQLQYGMKCKISLYNHTHFQK